MAGANHPPDSGRQCPQERMFRDQDDFILELIRRPISDLEARIAGLTSQERAVLYLAAKGYGNKQIAKLLRIGDTTVKVHTSRIFRKLGVGSRVQAALLLLWTRLLTMTPTEERCDPETLAAHLWQEPTASDTQQLTPNQS